MAASVIDCRVCVTAQHRQMLDQVLEFFEIVPDHDLNVMQKNQSLEMLTCKVLDGVASVIAREKPDMILVHGDTTTTFVTALSAFYSKIPIGHVEAGLRTGNLMAPWPEEANRRLTAVLAALHFAPTQTALRNLRKEGVNNGNILVTGNTVIDALLETQQRIASDRSLRERLDKQLPPIGTGNRVLLVTGHRRENFGSGFEQICSALVTLAKIKNLEIVYPVHFNPNVTEPVNRRLSGFPNIHLIEPLDYPYFVRLMDRSDVILTDSGGIQEEAPALGKPVLVMRDVTERPEAVEAGTVRLVGTGTNSIVTGVEELLENEELYEKMSRAHNPYGDGTAASKIVSGIRNYYAI